MRKFLTVLLCICLIGLSGCSSIKTQLSKASADFNSKEANVTCYSGGKAIVETRSQGKVFSETDSDGFSFIDRATGKLKEVSGDCVIDYD